MALTIDVDYDRRMDRSCRDAAIALTFLVLGCAKPAATPSPLQAQPVVSETPTPAHSSLSVPASTLRTPLPMPPGFMLGSNKFELRTDNSFRQLPFDAGVSSSPTAGALSKMLTPLATSPWKKKLASVVPVDPAKNAQAVALNVVAGKCYRAFALLPEGATGVLSLVDKEGNTVAEVGNTPGRSLLAAPEVGIACTRESAAASVMLSLGTAIGSGKSKADVPVEIWANE